MLSEAGILDVPAQVAHAEPRTPTDGHFVPLSAVVEDAERRHIRRALDRTAGSVMKTSEPRDRR